MRTEVIEIGHAKDGFRTQLHEFPSTQHLVGSPCLENGSCSDSSTETESINSRPQVREWLVLCCVSLVATLDAFDATMVVPIIPVCLVEEL